MSEEDDNVVNFGKLLSESKSTNAGTLEERVIQCMYNEQNGEECKCMYCVYKDGAAKMVVDFLANDFMNFENNTKGELSTYDLKDIFFKAIHLVKEMENRG